MELNVPLGPCLLLFEGVDKTGKSTDIARIRRTMEEQHRPVYVKQFGVPSGNPTGTYLNWLDEAAGQLDDGVSVLIDRMHWSQVAYQSVKRPANPANMTTAQFLIVEDRFRGLGGLVVLKVRDQHQLVLALDEDDYPEADDVGPLDEAFWGLHAATLGGTYTITFPDDQHDERLLAIGRMQRALSRKADK